MRLPGTDLREHPERPVFFENNLKQRKETGAVLCVVGCAVFLALPVAPWLMRRQAAAWRGKEKLSSPTPFFFLTQIKNRTKPKMTQEAFILLHFIFLCLKPVCGTRL